MLEHILSFQFGGFYGGEIGNVLASWEQAGVFSYVLPFLLIFAIVFGILAKIKVFGDNRALNAVIALVIGLLALQFELVPIFFSEIFPRLGVALSILLVLVVLAGLFFDTSENKVINYLLLGVAIIIFLTILVKSSGQLGWYSGYWWYANWPKILIVVAVLGALAAVISSGKPPQAPELKMHWPQK